MPEAAATPAFRRSIAVVVGIDQYGHGIPTLRTAVNDARRLGDVLARQHGYDVTAMLDAEATRARLVELLTHDLPARIEADDRVLFYFAGHGVAIDGHDGPNGYLLPVDANRGDESTYLTMPLVHDALLALPCRHMFIVLDSCFSGAFQWSGTRGGGAPLEVVHRERYERFVTSPARQVLTSASHDQEALDQLATGTLGQRDGDGDHSPFAVALFEGLGGLADLMPRDGGDALITANELYVYVDDRLQAAAQEAKRQQKPLLWPLTKHGKGEFVFTVPGRELQLPPAPPLDAAANPWRGLAAYEKGDAGLFFGRAEAAAALKEAIEQRPFVVVLGASGTGKSSLVKAGVLPALEADERWHLLPVVRPGTAPLDALAQAVATLAPGEAPTASRLDAQITAWCDAHIGARLLIVVDQCEELVTMARGDDGDATLTVLAHLLEAFPLQLTLVLTLRTDFEPDVERSALAAGWKDARFVVPPMSRADLKAVIEQPAWTRVLYFEPPTLVDELLDDVVSTPGGLPLLSFALSEMFLHYLGRQSTDRALTRADYDAIGGVVGALRTRADAEFDALDEAHRLSMQHLMLRMAAGSTGSLVKRRVSDAELTFADPAEGARTQAVLKRLTDARLVVEGRESGGDGYAEPAHDALVRGWTTLIRWMQAANGEAFPLPLRQKLAGVALEWMATPEGGEKQALLWSDPARSALLAPLVQAKAPWMNAAELSFADRSLRRRRRARYATIAITIGMAALAAASLVFALQSRRHAAEALTQQAAAEAAADRARTEEARAESEADRAQAEKARAVRGLFSSLTLSLRTGNAGSLCLYPFCTSAPAGDGDGEAWFSIGRIPDDIENLSAPDGEESRDFIAARDYGDGHVLAYAHDGLLRDSEIAVSGADNLTFAENALRWLDGAGTPAGCPASTTIAFWPGTYVASDQVMAVRKFIARRGWQFVVTGPETLERDLTCASVLWYLSDWYPPADFATTHVPRIDRFVHDGGGLLVGGLGWSYAEAGGPPPYGANVLGAPFGLKFSLNAFEASPRKPIRLLIE
ncbi:MAG: caspase family protein [Vicinamibacterales bacterium]